MIQLNKSMLVSTVFLSFCVVSAVAQEQTEEPVTLDISTIDCRTMLKMESDEQDYTLIYFHGFKSGQANEVIFNGPELLAATDAIMDYCIDNPSAPLMKAYDENR